MLRAPLRLDSMQSWRDPLLRLLSRDWAGLPVALMVAALFSLPAAVVGGATGIALALLGGLLALGLAAASLRHLLALARARRDHPPPGRLIDIGGYRVHLLAEGQARDGRPPVIWFAGGHASGLAIHHLHRAFRDATRSILIDRPGTGWSDVGPFPRSTAREALEVVLTLERAGERGPSRPSSSGRDSVRSGRCGAPHGWAALRNCSASTCARAPTPERARTRPTRA